MFDADLLQPLLDGLQPDDDPRHQRLLLETLTALPLSAAAWRAAAPAVTPAAEGLLLLAELDLPACELLARIPLRSTRRALLHRAGQPGARAAALALAQVGDASALPSLLQAFAAAPDTALAQALAALPLEQLPVSAHDLMPGLASAPGRDPDDAAMQRLWTALALARCGEFEPLEQLWDALVRPPAFFAPGARQRWFVAPPPLWQGDPLHTVAALTTLGPLPPRLQQFVQGLKDNDYDGWTPRHPASVGPGHAARLLILGLTEPSAPAQAAAPVPADATASAVRLARRMLPSPWHGVALALAPGERALLRHLPAELSAQVIEAGLATLSPDATPSAQSQALVDLAGALPPEVPLRIASLLQKPQVAALPAGALAWTLARAGAGTAVQALSPYILGSHGAERTRWMTWLARIAEQVDAPAPGGALRRPPVLIEDLTQARPALESMQPPGAACESAPAATPATRTVYPDLGVADPHPLAGAVVAFTVTLALQATDCTTGQVQIPASAPEAEHTLRVHLLLGSCSAWSTLRFSVARGSFEPARLSLPAPAVTGERELVPVRANFYLNQRWCGEGLRHLDVRRDASIAPLAAIPLPEAAPWRSALTLEPAALPPDLIVRIQKGPATGEFIWSCLSPHLDLPAPADPGDARMCLNQDAASYVRQTFGPLAGKTLDRLDAAAVCGAGETIYSNTPRHFQDSYWALWHAAAQGGFVFDSIQFVTDEPCVPWELMRLSDPQRAPDVAAEFLAVRHSVGRWLAGESSALRQHLPVQRLAVAASDYVGVAAHVNPLPWAAAEREMLVAGYHAEPVALNSHALLDFLEGGSVQAAHFACHGRMSVNTPDASLLVMEDSPCDLRPPHVRRREVCDGLGRQHPLIFLNACEVGSSAASLSLVAGFPAAFLYAGAAAVVSPLWAVGDEHARRIAEGFYQQVFVSGGGKPLGSVLRDLRARWKQEAHLTFLAYVLYGDPLARVSYPCA